MQSHRLAMSPIAPPRVRLSEVGAVLMGQSPPGTTYNDEKQGLPFFQGTRDFGYRHPTPRVHCEEVRRVAEPGDLLFSVRAPIGRINVADRRCGIGRGLAAVRARHASDARYLEYGLRALHRSWDTLEGNGSVFGNATRRDLEETLIPWPSPQRRHSISDALGALDDKIESNGRRSEILDQMARAVFTDWFVNFGPTRGRMDGCEAYVSRATWSLFPSKLVESPIGPLPETWALGSLGSVFALNPLRGLRRGCVAPYLDMANMPTRGHVPNRLIKRAFSSGTKFMNGDTLVARITPCLENGKTAYVDFLDDGEVAWGSTEILVLGPSEPLPSEYGYCLARSKRFRRFAIANLTGTSGRQRVSADALAALPVVMPSASVARAFGALVAPWLTRAASLRRDARALETVRDALLPGLLSDSYHCGRATAEKVHEQC